MSENKENINESVEEVSTINPSTGNELKDNFNDFFQGKVKYITYGVVAVAVVVLGYFGYQKFIVAPANIESAEAIYLGEGYIISEEWEKAINGDSTGYNGLIAQSKKLDGTAGGEIAFYDLGVAHMNLGQYEDALKAFKQVDLSDEILATMTLGAMGDASMELDKLKDAIDYYEQAYQRRPKNELTAPIYMMKLAGAHELDGKFDEAATLYWDLTQNFPNSSYKPQAQKYYVFAKEKVDILNL
jgi:tetratricopeptide (TPR) repeat protein